MTRVSLVAALALIATPALADIRVDFREGAPKDRFTLTNVGACALDGVEVTIDLTGSQGKLIFDVTGSGAGVEVFQPFEVVSGAEYLVDLPQVEDGQTQVTLRLSSLAAGAKLIATTDLDDTIGAREITVAGSEFDGTRILVESAGGSAEAAFDGTVSAVAKLNGCA